MGSEKIIVFNSCRLPNAIVKNAMAGSRHSVPAQGLLQPHENPFVRSRLPGFEKPIALVALGKRYADGFRK